MFDTLVCGPPLIAQSSTAATRGLLWLGGILVVVVVFVGLLGKLRRKLSVSGSGSPAGFSMEDLHRLRDSGRLSVAEYEALRDKTVRGQGVISG